MYISLSCLEDSSCESDDLLTALAENAKASDQHGNRLVKCTGCLIDDIVRTVMAAAVKHHQDGVIQTGRFPSP